MEDCIFCKIVKGEISTQFIMKTENVVAFFDIHPLEETHILILPKEHITSFLEINITHKDLISEMIAIAQTLIKDYNLKRGYKIMFNGGKFQHIPHLHMHLLGGDIK